MAARILGLAALCLALTSAPARAGEEAASNASTEAAAPDAALAGNARELFQEGRAAMTAGDVQLACSKFRQSLSLKDTAGTLLNLALCEDKLGNLVRAWELLQEVLGRLEAGDARRDIAQEALSALMGRLALVTLELQAGAPDGSVAHRATGEALPFGRPLAFVPGESEIQVDAPGFESRTYPLELEAGVPLDLLVTAGPRLIEATPTVAPAVASSPAVAPTKPTPPRPAPLRGEADAEPARSDVASVTALAVGALGLAVSAIAGVVVLRARETVDRECQAIGNGKLGCTDKGLRAGERGRRYLTIGDAAFGVGVAGCVTGGYLWLAGPDNTPTAAGVSWSGTF